MEVLEVRNLLTAGVALDPTFGQGGLATTDVVGRSGDAAVNLAITEPDGKILVAGNASQAYAGAHFLLARYNADGTLDASFGAGGFVTTTLGYNWNARAMAVDGSGRIVVVGDAEQGAALVRYNPDGSLDQSFGAGGLVTTRFENSLSIARGVAIDSAGRIDVVGEVYHTVQQQSGYQLLLARYQSDGSLDTSFGDSSGATLTSLGIYPTAGNALAIDASGNLVVAGSYGISGNLQSLVARFTNDGILDANFNRTGIALSTFGGAAQANAVAIDSNQDIVIAGGATINAATYIAAARYTTAGALDDTFNRTGEVETYAGGFGDIANGLAIDASGRVVLAARGQFSSFTGLRYTSSGVLDGSFGQGGKANVSFGPALTTNQANAVAVTPAGQILLVGYASDSTAVNDLALARLNSDGSVDAAFGPNRNGTVLSSFPLSTSNDARAMAIESDGKIVMAGSAWPITGRVFSVERYNDDGSLDPSFGDGGVALANVTGITYPTFDNTANALAIDSLGRIIVAGTVDHLAGGTDIAVVRYNPDGSLDASFGTGGIVLTSLVVYGYNQANSVAIDAAGDILVGGATSPAQTASQSNFALLRYTTNGQLDTRFGGAVLGGGPGWVQTDFAGRRDLAYSMVLQPDAKIVLAGSANLASTGDDFALARYNSDGSLDTTFGGKTGKVTTNLAPTANSPSIDDAYGVTLDSQGRLIAAGASNAVTPFYGFALARYNTDGALDASFGTGGKALIAPNLATGFAGPVIVTPQGKILVGGEFESVPQDRNFMIARYNDDGTLDTTFTSTGVLTTDFGGGKLGWDQIYGMALDHQGRLVAAGASFHPNSSFDVGLARYVLDSTLTASAGGSYSLNEGDSLKLAATASGGDGGALAYSWDVNGDGVFGDATGSSPTLAWQQLEALSPPINDGPATFRVSVRVSDAHGEYVVSAPVTLTLNDAPPTASASAASQPAIEVVGQPQAFNVSASDPSPVDTAAGFSFIVDWGDGSPQQTVSAADAALPVWHVFTHSGSFTVSVWAVDQDGDRSASPATFAAVVSSAAMEGTTLVVGGNNVVLRPSNANGGVSVTVDGSPEGAFVAPDQIIIYGLAGGDTIRLNDVRIGHHRLNISAPAVIFGGADGDTIDARGSSANNVLVGGAGNDVLHGGSGRNLLIGGGGADALYAGSDGDILIGGTTDYDANLAALNAIMAEWGRTDLSYDQRIAHVDGSTPGGLNGTYILSAATVRDDGGSDELVGGRGLDWYFASADDVVIHKKRHEVVTAV